MAQNTRDHIKIIWLALKGISYLEVICMLFWIKFRLVCFKLQTNGTENGSSNIKDPSTKRFQLQMPILPVLQVCASPRLNPQV